MALGDDDGGESVPTLRAPRAARTRKEPLSPPFYFITHFLLNTLNSGYFRFSRFFFNSPSLKPPAREAERHAQAIRHVQHLEKPRQRTCPSFFYHGRFPFFLANCTINFIFIFIFFFFFGFSDFFLFLLGTLGSSFRPPRAR